MRRPVPAHERPKSRGISILIGFAGAALGYLNFTVGRGIGDTDVFDLGGIIGAVIGVFIVPAIASAVMKNRGPSPGRPAS